MEEILTSFILPPGIFVLFLALLSAWLLLKKQWKTSICSILIGAFIWILSTSPISDALLKGLEFDFKIPKDPAGDVIILLGGGIHSGAADLSGIGAPVDAMLARVIAAVRLHETLSIPIIVSGGAAVEGEKSEAFVVKRILVDLEVPAYYVIMEDRSSNTMENAIFTQKICIEYNYKFPILVTSAFHMRRAVWSFERVEMSVLPFPAGFKTWEAMRYDWRDYLPSSSSLRNSSIAIREYLGLLFYRLAY